MSRDIEMKDSAEKISCSMFINIKSLSYLDAALLKGKYDGELFTEVEWQKKLNESLNREVTE